MVFLEFQNIIFMNFCGGIGLATVLLEGILIALTPVFLSGLSYTEGIIAGTGFFLAFEMVICTGAVIAKIEKKE